MYSKKFLLAIFATVIILSLFSLSSSSISTNMIKQNEPLESQLEYIKSDEEFDYYTIKLSNNSKAVAGILYDPAAFNPNTKEYNRLFCGGSNKEEKRYTAVLYHIDHLEISDILKIAPNTCTKLYVKWEKTYTDWKKSLHFLYYWANEDETFSINDIDAKYLNIDFKPSPSQKNE